MKKIFFILIFLLLLWSLFVNQNWLYIDNWWFPLTDVKKWSIIFSFFEPLSLWTYFWYDEYTLQSSRFLGNFFIVWWEFFLFFLFFLINFISSYFVLKIFFSKKSSLFWALIYTFNPVSFSFLNLSGFIFAYTSLPLIIMALYKIFTTKKWMYVLLLIASLYFFISYTRISGLYFVILFLFAVFYYKEIWNFVRKNRLYSVFLFFLIFASFSPFIFSLFYPYIDWQKAYFSGLWNYAASGLSWSEWFYHHVKYTPFYNQISFKEITDNFWKYFYSSDFFVIFSFVFIIWTLIVGFFLKNLKNNRIFQFVSILFLCFIFLLSWAKFLSYELFTNIAYKYFPFIANQTNWLYVLLIPLFVFIFTSVLENVNSQKYKNIFKFFAVLYIFIVFIPIIHFWNNEKLALMSVSDFPKEYQKTFHKSVIEKESSLFFPLHNLYFDWSSYPISLFNNNSYVSLFSDNSRLVNEKQANLANSIIDLKNRNFIDNLFIFNLKNIFVFKDVKNAKEWQFDFFPVKDYEKESKEYYKIFKNNKNLYTKQDNENFAQFGLKNDDAYEYFLYAPAKIERYDMEEFFATGNTIDITKKPINIDSKSFHKPKEIERFEIPKENQNIAIRYKKSVLQPSKIYAKFWNFDQTKPFLVQLNQTFGMSWKLKWITKEEFEEKKCEDEYQSFEITQNTFCNYKAQILDVADTKYLKKSSIPESQHFEGNFVGNTWLIQPENIPEDMKNQDELYAVIIYEKQIWYNWALIISLSTVWVLIALTLGQYVYSLNRKNYEKLP